MTTCKAAKTYIRKVRRHLICSKGNRARIMKTVQEAVDAYLEDEPEATFSGLVRSIGEPKAFAGSLLERVAETEVKNARRHRILKTRACLIALAAVITVTLTALGGFYLKYQDTLDNGTVIIYSSIYYPEGTGIEEASKFAEQYIAEKDKLLNENRFKEEKTQ